VIEPEEIGELGAMLLCDHSASITGADMLFANWWHDEQACQQGALPIEGDRGALVSVGHVHVKVNVRSRG